MKLLCCVFTIAFAINLCGTVPLKGNPAKPEKYDFLTLSVNYRAGFCINNTECAAPDKSFRPRWTIHGLWPSTPGNTGPSDCPANSPNSTFDINDLKPIRAQMGESWPTYKKGSPDSFWKHEFDKHGSCAIVLKVKDVTNVTSYFKKGLDLNAEYNVTKYLAGIKVSNDVPVALKNLTDAVKKSFAKKVQFYCKGQKNNTDILREIRLCFDKDLRPYDCPDDSNCNTENVWYLKNGASSLTFSAVIMTLLAIMSMINKNSL